MTAGPYFAALRAGTALTPAGLFTPTKEDPMTPITADDVTTRPKHAWDVEVQASNGAVQTERVNGYWDPSHALTADTVRLAARTQAWLASGKQREYAHAGDPQLVTAAE